MIEQPAILLEPGVGASVQVDAGLKLPAAADRKMEPVGTTSGRVPLTVETVAEHARFAPEGPMQCTWKVDSRIPMALAGERVAVMVPLAAEVTARTARA